MSIERKKQHWNIRVFTLSIKAVFFSMLLLSDVGIAGGRKFVKIAQQQSQSQPTTRTAAKQAFEEGKKLYQQGTAESRRLAIGSWEIALKLYRQVDDKSWEAIVLLHIGRVYSDLGEKQKALSYFDQALPLHRAVGDRDGEANTLRNLALLERSKNNLLAALTHIETAIDIIEDLRTKIDSQDLRTSYFASVQGYYKLKIDLLMQLHKKDPSIGYNAEALHISERSRARVLLELLTEAQAGIRKDVDPKLLAEEKRLQELIDAKEKLRFDLVNSRKIEDPIAKASALKLEKEVLDLINQHKELQTKIRTSSPKYAALKYPEPLKLPEIQQQLDKDTLLLQYSLGEERSYLWAVTTTSITSYELPLGAEIEAAAKEFYQLLNNPGNNLYTRGGINVDPRSASGSASVNSASKLSQMLLQPVASQLGNKRLLIVGDGALQYVPFAALPDLTKQTQPLLVNHEIINLPSATTIAIQRKELAGRKVAPKTLAILADPVFNAEDARVTGKSVGIAPDLDLEQSTLKRAARNLNRNGWGRLEATRIEAETGKEVSGEGLVGLTRGLMYAGAARVVVSLWKVDDQGTSMLMQEFYKQLLQQGRSPTAALRAAQLNMWVQQKWHNPYYWSAFTFQGEWR